MENVASHPGFVSSASDGSTFNSGKCMTLDLFCVFCVVFLPNIWAQHFVESIYSWSKEILFYSCAFVNFLVICGFL